VYFFNKRGRVLLHGSHQLVSAVSTYGESIMERFLEAAGIKKINIPVSHGSILSASFILASKDLVIMPEESIQTCRS
jgi:hypothetical protein